MLLRLQIIGSFKNHEEKNNASHNMMEHHFSLLKLTQ